MRYRALTPTGDYQFGQPNVFLTNVPQAVAQAITTRLLLWEGEWFLDTTEGTPYYQKILGYGTQGTKDLALRDRILNTPGVTEIIEYTSNVDANRKMTVSCRVNTLYGVTSVNVQV